MPPLPIDAAGGHRDDAVALFKSAHSRYVPICTRSTTSLPSRSARSPRVSRWESSWRPCNCASCRRLNCSDGFARSRPQRWTHRRRGTIPIANTALRTVLESTITMLDAEAREVLLRSAIINGAMSVDIVDSCCREREIDALAQLGDLLEAGLVTRTPDSDQLRVPIPVRQYVVEALGPLATVRRGGRSARGSTPRARRGRRPMVRARCRPSLHPSCDGHGRDRLSRRHLLAPG